MAVSRDRDNEMRSLRLFFDDRASSIRGRSVGNYALLAGGTPAFGRTAPFTVT